MGEFERPNIFRDGLLQDRFARVEGKAGRQGIFNFAECARADLAVLRQRLLLFRGADLHLGFQLAAGIEGRQQGGPGTPYRIVPLLEHEKVAGDARHGGGQRDLRQSCRFCLFGAVERSGDPSLGGDDVGASLEEIGRHADRDGGGHRGQIRGHGQHRRRIASGKDLDRAQGLPVGEFEVLRGVPEGLQVCQGQAHVVFVTDADALPVLRQAGQARGRDHGLIGEALLQACLRREEPAFCDLRNNRLPREFR